MSYPSIGLLGDFKSYFWSLQPPLALPVIKGFGAIVVASCAAAKQAVAARSSGREANVRIDPTVYSC